MFRTVKSKNLFWISYSLKSNSYFKEQLCMSNFYILYWPGPNLQLTLQAVLSSKGTVGWKSPTCFCWRLHLPLFKRCRWKCELYWQNFKIRISHKLGKNEVSVSESLSPQTTRTTINDQMREQLIFLIDKSSFLILFSRIRKKRFKEN